MQRLLVTGSLIMLYTELGAAKCSPSMDSMFLLEDKSYFRPPSGKSRPKELLLHSPPGINQFQEISTTLF